jgi:PAS domain-containing protein
LRRDLARLPKNTIVIYLTMFQDGTGERFIPRDLAQMISDAATAPVYGVYEPYVGRAVVGGYVESFEAIGREAARIGLHILAGDLPESLPPGRVETQAFMVDWRQLRRWGLDETRLPRGTIVRFEEPSLWKQYRREILAVIAVVLLQSALIVALLLQQRRRRFAEESLRESDERYRDVVETQSEMICRYLPDSTLTFVNDAYCRYSGRSREELVGSPFIGLILESERAAALEHIKAMAVRWPGVIPAGWTTGEFMTMEDWLPTIMAQLGQPELKEQLLEGHQVGDTTHRVHLDGYDQSAILTGTGPSQRKEFFYFTEAQFHGIRYGDWKFLFTEQDKWFNGVKNDLVTPLITNHKLDPFERFHEARGFDEWQENRSWTLAPAMGIVQRFFASFQEYPPRQASLDFDADAIMREMMESQGH